MPSPHSFSALQREGSSEAPALQPAQEADLALVTGGGTLCGASESGCHGDMKERTRWGPLQRPGQTELPPPRAGTGSALPAAQPEEPRPRLPKGGAPGRCPSEGPLWDALGLTSAAAPAAFLTVKPTTPSTLQLGWILVSKKETEKFCLSQADTGAPNTVSQQTWARLRTAAVWPSAPRPQQGARRQGSPRPGQAWGCRAPGLGAGGVHPARPRPGSADR